MMYASKIKVNTEPQEIKKTITNSLGHNGTLTISFLKKLKLKDEDEFYIYQDEYSKEMFIQYTIRRMETKKETTDRAKKEIQYNKNYDIFHAKNKK